MSLLWQLLGRLTWKLAGFWLVLVGGFWLFVEFAANVYDGSGFPFDEAVLHWFYGVRADGLTGFMYWMSVIGDVPATMGAAAVILLLLWLFLRREAPFFLLSLGGAALIMVVAKYGLGRARPELFPDGALYHTASPSFPSGHATGSAALYLTLYLIARHHWPRWAWLVGVLGAAMTLTISASRLYLQVHYPSDILAGLALASAWVLGIHGLYHRDRSGRFLLLLLPVDVAEAVHDESERREKSPDELVGGWLAERLGVPLEAPDAPSGPASRAPSKGALDRDREQGRVSGNGRVREEASSPERGSSS